MGSDSEIIFGIHSIDFVNVSLSFYLSYRIREGADGALNEADLSNTFLDHSIYRGHLTSVSSCRAKFGSLGYE